MLYNINFYLLLYSFLTQILYKMKVKRKKSQKQVNEILKKIKSGSAKIVFRTKKMLVTLRNERQLKVFMEKYPDGVVEFK